MMDSGPPTTRSQAGRCAISLAPMAGHDEGLLGEQGDGAHCRCKRFVEVLRDDDRTECCALMPNHPITRWPLFALSRDPRVLRGPSAQPFNRGGSAQALAHGLSTMRRFVQAFSAESRSAADLSPEVNVALAELPARYNISVGQPAGVLFIHEGSWKVANMAWGLIPSWEPLPTTRYSTQTARLERAPRSRMYRRAWAHRRCAVPRTDNTSGTAATAPACSSRRPRAMSVRSGMWSLWARSRREVLSFSILTHPNAAIRATGCDGPVFIRPALIGQWIGDTPDGAARMLRRAAQPALEAYRVGRRVANRKLDDYALLEPAPPQEPDADPDGHEIEDDD